MVNENDMKRVRRLLALLRAEGIDCIIAGGFARDKFFEATPKDIDIICAGVPHEVIATLFEVPTALAAVSKFDYNLNQFVYNEDTEESVYVGEGNWHKLVRLRDDARGSREEKMRLKFAELVEGNLDAYFADFDNSIGF